MTDTNILLRSIDLVHPLCQEAVASVELLRLRGDVPCLVPQNVVEFRAVRTRPFAVNGLGMNQRHVREEIARLKLLFPLFDEGPAVFAEWERLLDAYGASDKQNHDARLVAAMNVHAVPAVLTFNKRDFTRYPEITVTEPKDLLAPSPP